MPGHIYIWYVSVYVLLYVSDVELTSFVAIAVCDSFAINSHSVCTYV